MKLLTIAVVLNLLFISTISHPFFFSQDSLQSTTYYKCYYSQTGLDHITIGIDYTIDQVDQKSLQNIQNVLNAGLKVDAILKPTHENVDEEIQFMVKNQFNVFSKFWLAFFPGIKSSDSSGVYEDFCPYVLKLTKRMRETFNVEVGIAANIQLWNFLFHDTTYCSQLAKQSPLLWVLGDLDNQPNFDSFQPFSGWKTPYAKLYRYTYVCGSELLQCYYE